MADDLTETRAALRWALRTARDHLGPFKGGGSIGMDAEDNWLCYGCRSNIWIGTRVPFNPDNDFPHENGCLYVKAVRAAGET